MNGNYKSLTGLTDEVNRQDLLKEDYLVPAGLLRMEGDDTLLIDGSTPYGITDIAHQQIAEKLGIPKRYYDRMAEVPDLRTYNVNTWFSRDRDSRLVRTLDGNARALLSDRYKPLDNALVLGSVEPIFKGMEIEVKSTSLTESRMYVQVVFPKVTGEIAKGDKVQAGIILTNSEVGHGAVDVSTVIWRLICSNGMIGKSVLNRYHVGRKVGADVDDYDIFRRDTIKAEMQSFQLRLRDVITYAVSEAFFEDQLLKMRTANEDKIENIPQTVKNVTKRFNIPEYEENLIVQNILNDDTDARKTRWGLANGITAMSHQVKNPDSQYWYEKIGNDVIELNKSEWEVLSA